MKVKEEEGFKIMTVTDVYHLKKQKKYNVE